MSKPKPKAAPVPVPELPPGLSPQPEGYADWLAELRGRIHTAQQRATLAVNRELVHLYWQIGRDILARQSQQGWGTKVIDWLAHDLRTTFPDMNGFSPRNLKYMRASADAWPDAGFVQVVLAQLPWYHQLALFILQKKMQVLLLNYPQPHQITLHKISQLLVNSLYLMKLVLVQQFHLIHQVQQHARINQ